MAKAVRKYTNKKEAVSAVQEYPALAYAAVSNMGNLARVMYWLGLSGPAAKKISTSFDFISLGNTGITKASIDALASHLGISKKYISEEIFDVSVKTFERKESKARLDKRISSHALEIARVVQHAHEVFLDEEKVKRWLNRENRALNNLKPVELFGTLTGINMVNDVLGRIEEGVYS